MFKSRYVFETKGTRAVRYLKNGLLITFAGIPLSLGAALVLITIGRQEINKSKDAFFERKPDLIAVFTGDKGRIPLALKMAKDYQLSNIFISGVHKNNTVNGLVAPLDLVKKNDSENIDIIDTKLLDIDYEAKNTIQNVKHTLAYLRREKGANFSFILVVSHDYHLPRVRYIFSKLAKEDDGFSLFFTGVKSEGLWPRTLKLSLKELLKLARTVIFLST